MDKGSQLRFIYGAMKTLGIEHSDRQTLIAGILGHDRRKGFSDCSIMEIGMVYNHLRAQLPEGKMQTKNNKEYKAPVRQNTPEENKLFNMKKKLISCAYTMEWAKPGEYKTALKAIDNFVQGKTSLFHKPLTEHTVEELVKVVTQFELLVKSYYKSLSK